VLGLLALAGGAQADTVFLDINGIDGDVIQKGREGFIEVDAFSFDYGRTAATRTRPAGPRFGDLVVTKQLDKSSPVFFDRFNTRQQVPPMHLKVFRVNPNLGTEQLFMEYCFGGVLVNRTAKAFGGSGEVSEQITFHFDRVGEQLSATPAVFAAWDLVGATTIGFQAACS